MIDGFRRRRRDSDVHPVVRAHSAGIVVGGLDKVTAQRRAAHDEPPDFKPPEVAATEDERDPVIGDTDERYEVARGDAPEVPEAQPADDEPVENTDDHTEETIDEPDEEPPEDEDDNSESPKKHRKHRRSLKEWLKTRTKKQWIIIGVIAAVLLGGGGYAAYALLHHPAKPAPVVHVQKKKAVVVPKPTTVASTLTGLQVDPSVNQLPVTGLMIENSTLARPQSGLDKAGVVFEAVAEGGITRFLTLWQDTNAPYVGPVRSVRPYYIQWALGFDAAIGHVGGSPEALADMKSWNVKDLDQFYNGGSYQRIPSRAAPHNVYTSLDQLNALEAAKGFGVPHYTGFERKIDAPSKTPNPTSVDLTISSSDFNVHYDYDATTNAYKRSEGGVPHMEIDQAGAQTQITPKVVIALVMTQGIEADDLHTSYGTIGSGHMYVFQDGIVTEGTWTKTGNTAQFTFADASGQTIKLNAGQTWITAVSSTGNVAFK
ncbi:MAG TPA: DUF3048 domain-containing protein [Patescibacteria group bacterium]|nr:DUF3048 domain-containing protein [Patescibacteria group bacterium]